MATLVEDEGGFVAIGCGVAVSVGISVGGISVGVGGTCVDVGGTSVGEGCAVGVAVGGGCVTVAVSGTAVDVGLAGKGVGVLLSNPQRASSILAAVAPAICKKCRLESFLGFLWFLVSNDIS